MLDEIQARADAAADEPRAYVMARRSQKDVPKLVAALRAVDAVCVAFDAGVGLGPGKATEQSHQTKMIRTAIREALNG